MRQTSSEIMAGKNGEESRYSLAYREISHLPERHKKRISQKNIRVLDLSHNNFSDLRTLNGLTSLQTLVLDYNLIQSRVVCPMLPNLEILWVNCNNIENLPLFLETVAESFPNLKHISMMKNKAAPSFFNGGSVQEHKDYRLYVLSILNKLSWLDDCAISEEERKASSCIYGKRRPKSKP